MTTQVLFVQGAGEGAHAEDAELAEGLRVALGAGYAVHYPPMPREGDPDDDAWGDRIAAEMERLGDGVILVGHSAGAVTILLLLARGNLGQGAVAAIFLAGAPFFGRGGWHVEGFDLPEGLGEGLTDLPVFFYHGDADEIVPVAHLDLYAEALPRAAVRRLPGRSHQLDGDMSEVAADIRSIT